MRSEGVKSPGLPSRTLILLGVFVASFQAVALAPASLLPAIAGFERMGVRYEAAEGRLWSGILRGVEVRGVSLGDVDFELGSLSLLAGSADIRFSVSGGALTGTGRGRYSLLGRTELADSRLLFSLGAVTQFALLGEPLDGSLRIETARLVIDKDGCVEGNVRFTTDVLKAPAQKLGAAGFDLAGTGQCDAGDFVAELSGEGAEGAASLVVRVTPELAYSFAASVDPARSEVATALEALGFNREDEGLTTKARGTIEAIGS